MCFLNERLKADSSLLDTHSVWELQENTATVDFKSLQIFLKSVFVMSD